MFRINNSTTFYLIKFLILTKGDPTVYGNFKTHEIVSNAVVNAVNTYKNNGYGPTNGTSI